MENLHLQRKKARKEEKKNGTTKWPKRILEDGNSKSLPK